MNKCPWIDVQSLLRVLQKHWFLLSISWWCFREEQGVEKTPSQLTFSSTSDKQREKSCRGLYCCALVHKTLWNDSFWLKPMILREILIKKNEKVPLYCLKSLKTITALQETRSNTSTFVANSVPILPQICQQFFILSFFCLQTENSLSSDNPARCYSSLSL